MTVLSFFFQVGYKTAEVQAVLDILKDLLLLDTVVWAPLLHTTVGSLIGKVA